MPRSYALLPLRRLVRRLCPVLGVVFLVGGALLLGPPQAHAQQPAPETVFDRLKEDGRIEQLPPAALQQRARRNPGTLTPQQRRRLRAYQRTRASGQVGTKARSSQLDYKDPVQTNGATPWPSSDLNFRPNRTPQRAGDVNNDGVNDWLYLYTPGFADDRTSALSDRTPKMVLKFGGSGAFSSSYYDEMYYRNLEPVGNFVGGDGADAIEVLRNGYRILEGGTGGYTEVARKSALPDRVSFVRTTPVDLDGNGYDDIVLPNRSDSTITVLYGAQNPADVTRKTDTLFFQDFSNYFTYATGNVNPATSSDAEIVRIGGRTDTTATAPSDSMRVDIIGTDGSRGLTVDTTFRISPFQDVPPPSFYEDGFTFGDRFWAELVDMDGAGLKEIILRGRSAFDLGQYAAVYTETAGGGTYDNTALPLRPDAVSVGDLNGDGREDFFLENDTSIAFGKQAVSDGLTADEPVPRSASERINLYDFVGNVGQRSRNRLGDINDDGDDEFIAEFGGTDQFGARLVDASGGTASTTDFAFDESEYGRQNVITTRNVGDWNGDGSDDVAFVFRDGRVELYFGDPTTSLSPDLTLTNENAFGTDNASLAAGDFTGNGQQNLAVGWRSDSRAVAIYEAGQGASPVHTIGIEDLGIPATANSLNDSPQDGPASTVGNVGDVNADGVEDLAVAVPNADTTAAQAAFVYLGQETLSTSPDVTIDYTDDGASMYVGTEIEALGDINDDGIDDFAVGDNSSGTGGIYVHFGRDAATPSFGAPDETITLQSEGQGSFFFFPWGMTAGDFNGDGIPDLAAKPFGFEDGAEGGRAVRIYEGGAFFDGRPERTLRLPGFLQSANNTRHATQNSGELTTLPPASDSTGDRLLVGTYSPTNALIFTPYKEIGANGGNEPTSVGAKDHQKLVDSGMTLLRAPDQSDGIGSSSISLNLPQDLTSAVGDFNADGRLEAVLPQPDNPNYLGSPAHTYRLGPVGGAAGPEGQPVATETKQLDASEADAGGSTVGFRTPRIDVFFTGDSFGEAKLTASQYAGRPYKAESVSEENVSDYYVRIGQEPAYEYQEEDLYGDITLGQGSEVRFDVSVLPGMDNPGSVTVYQRDLADAGSFEALPTSYNAETGELVAQTKRVGEFVFGSDADSLKRSVAVPKRLEATAAADSVTLDWGGTSGASEYVVYRSTAPISWAEGPSQASAFDTTTATALTDRSVQVGQSYYYRVTAVTGGGTEGGFSPQSRAKPAFVLGSPSGDEVVTAGDAGLVRRYAVDLAELGPSQQRAADVSGDGSINAADASLIQQYVVDLIEVFPADTVGKAGGDGASLASQDEVRGRLTWGAPKRMTGETGQQGTVRVPVRLAGTPTNVRSVQLEASYDTSSVRIVGVETGALPRGWRAAQNVHVSEGEGAVDLALSGTEPLGAGPVATLVLETRGEEASVEGAAALYTAERRSMERLRLEGAPERFRVEENYPNPFSRRTRIRYALPEQTTVEIAVYDVLGRRVRTLVDREQEAGTYTTTLEAGSLTSGTYFYRVQTESASTTGQMVIVR